MSRWYIIHAYSGFENKVKDQILADAHRMGLDALVEAVEVPTEKVTEIRRGKKVTSDRKFFPGYVLAKLSMSDQVYHLVKNTPKVTPAQFIQQVRAETAKVSWPTRKETITTAVMVVIMTTMLAVFFFAVDSAFGALVKFLLGLLG